MLIENIARRATELASCQHIRFRVYCRERQFLREADYPHQAEHDDFDGVATHVAVLGDDGEPVGTARLVPPSMLGFPYQRYCGAKVPKAIRATTAEVSRLAVPRSVAKRHCDPQTADMPGRRVALQLYQLIYSVTKLEGLTHLVAAMEPSLVRICGVYDIPWKPIGPEVNYGGWVRPYLMSLAEFDATMTKAAIRFRKESARPSECARIYPALTQASVHSTGVLEARNEAICDRGREAAAP